MSRCPRAAAWPTADVRGLDPSNVVMIGGYMRRWTTAAILLTVRLAAQTPGSGTVYPSMSTVSLADFGVSFQVPQGWTALAKDQPGALVLTSMDGNLIGLLFLKAEVSESEMKGFFADKTEGILRLEHTPVAGYANGWSFDFRDTDEGMQGTGRAVLSTSSAAALVMVMGKGVPPASLAGPAETWIRALRFTAKAKPQDGRQPQARPSQEKPGQ